MPNNKFSVPPEISIILTSYNKFDYLKESISSVLDQSFKDLELIIVDDHSTDQSIKYLEDLAQGNEKITLIKNQENKGANYSRNIGIKVSTGKYVIFIDADDIIIPSCLQNRIYLANKTPMLDLIVFTMGVFYKKIGDDKRTWIPNSKEPLTDFLKHKLPWSILQPIWKRDFLKKLGGFDESFKRLQDVELHTRALLQPDIKYQLICSEPDCYYRIDEERKTSKPFEFMERWVDSAIKYCDKFKNIVKKEDRYNLIGTLYQTELQVINNYKKGQFSLTEYDILKNRLKANSLYKELGFFKRKLIQFARVYNLHFIRVPGMNRVIFGMLMFKPLWVGK